MGVFTRGFCPVIYETEDKALNSSFVCFNILEIAIGLYLRELLIEEIHKIPGG
jgi:hypothetical protein